MALRELRVTTTGTAGSATGTATLGFDQRPCLLEAIKLNYHASAPATTDVSIVETGGLGRELLAVANTATDGVYYPRHALHNASGVEGAGLVPYVVEGPIQVNVEGCDALADAVVVTLQLVENPRVH